jgi:uncharacterized YccA/Bax inhibitor family protein
MIASFVATIVVGLVIYRKPKTAPIVAPLHAGVQGVWAGALSAIIPAQFLNSMEVFSGGATTLIMQAVLATMGICAAMLVGYATGVLRVGPFFQKVIITMGAGLLFYVVAMFILQFLGIQIWNGFADTGPIGIGFTVLCLGLASLYLLLDFKFIEEGVKNGAPKYMEWVGAWGLMVTPVKLHKEQSPGIQSLGFFNGITVFHTLNRKWHTSESCITYSLPSMRILPASLIAFSLLYFCRSSTE